RFRLTVAVPEVTAPGAVSKSTPGLAADVVPEPGDNVAPAIPPTASVKPSEPLVVLTVIGTAAGAGEPVRYRTWIGFGDRLTTGAWPAGLSTDTTMAFTRKWSALSRTVTLTRKVPAYVGVPDRLPPLIASPGGISPRGDARIVYGGVPPDTVNETEYG